jgi:hypothetical protein
VKVGPSFPQVVGWQGKSSGLGNLQSFFGGNATGFTLAIDDNILTEQCFSLQFFLHGFSETRGGFDRHFTWSFCSHLIASKSFLRRS